MNKEDKSLLLKDLCARLPYKVIIKSVGENKIIGLLDLRDIDNLPLPYLRPMSSMTDEEDTERFYCMEIDGHGYPIGVDEYYFADYLDWLNAKHFDYRGLIEKGLAIEVTEENNPYK